MPYFHIFHRVFLCLRFNWSLKAHLFVIFISSDLMAPSWRNSATTCLNACNSKYTVHTFICVLLFQLSGKFCASYMWQRQQSINWNWFNSHTDFKVWCQGWCVLSPGHRSRQFSYMDAWREVMGELLLQQQSLWPTLVLLTNQPSTQLKPRQGKKKKKITVNNFLTLSQRNKKGGWT